MPCAAPQVEIQKFSEWFGALGRVDYRRLKQVGCRLEIFFHSNVVPFTPSTFRFKIVNNTQNSITWRVVQNLRLSNECFVTISPSRGVVERKASSTPISVNVVLFHALTLKHMLYVECSWGNLGKTFYLPIGLNVKPAPPDTSLTYWRVRIPTTDQLSVLCHRQGGSVFLCSLLGVNVVMKTWAWGSKDPAPPSFDKQLSTFLSLNHPNLIRLIGAITDQCEASLVIEYAANGCLTDFCASLSVPINNSMPTRCVAALDVARALAYLHSKSKVHSKVSGRSVLIDQDFHAKLSSFGSILDVVDEAEFLASPDYVAGSINQLTRSYNCYQFGLFLWELITDRPQEEVLPLIAAVFSCPPAEGSVYPTMVPISQSIDAIAASTPHLQCELVQTFPDYIVLMLNCLNPNPAQRPGIVDIVGELTTICDTPEPRTLLGMNLSTNLTLKDEHLLLLPRTLANLDLSCNQKITVACAPHLPITLQTLNLAKSSVSIELAEAYLTRLASHLSGSSVEDVDPSVWSAEYGTLTLPRWVMNQLSVAGLAKLQGVAVKRMTLAHAAHLTDAHIAALPRTLTRLDFDEPSGASITDDGVRKLPRQLVSLTLPTSLLSCFAVNHLPPALTELYLPHTSQLTSDFAFPAGLVTLCLGDSSLFSDFAFLPQSLKFIDLGRCPVFTDADLSKLPPDIQSLSISENASITSQSIASLPRSLTALRITGNPHFGVASREEDWPPGLISLELPDNTSLASQGQTTSNNSLTARHARPRGDAVTGGSTPHNTVGPSSDALVLPTGLTRLELTSNEHITNEYVSQLPRSLTFLEVSDETYLTEAGLPHLPAALTTLNIVIPSTYVRELPRRLTSLNIERCHTLVDGCLSDLPAGLVFLKLTCSRVTNAGLLYLPQKLRTLHLIDNVYITDEGVKNLPQSLSKLIIDDGDMLTTACFSLLPRDLVNLVLPPNLMNEVTDDSIGELPRAITELNLERNENITNAGIVRLPRTLTSLNLASNENLTDFCIRHMPRGLIYLNVAMSDYLSPSCLVDLPPCQTIVLPNRLLQSIRDRHILDLPRLLTSWDMEHNVEVTAKSFQFLPRCLTKLNLAPQMVLGLNDARAKFLPPVLTELQLAHNTILTNSAIRYLPLPLTHLDLYWNANLTDEAIPLLPRALLYLNLGCSDQLTDEAAHHLPRKLVQLLIDGNSNFTDRFIQGLPRSLTYMDLSHAFRLSPACLGVMPPLLTSWEMSPNFLNSIPPSFIQLIPRQLLKLNMWGNTQLTDQCFGSLPAQLTYLNISSATGISNYAIPFLPNTLKTLTLEDNQLLEDSSISYLPKGITFLNLASAVRLTENSGRYFPPNLLYLDLSTNTTVNDAWIASLPRSLQSLSVQSGKLTTECLAALPPNLLNFDMPRSLIMSIAAENAMLLPRSLTTLNLWCNTLLTNAGIKSLPKVNSLNIAQNSTITDAGLLFLPQSLTSLNISSSKISNSGVRDLPKSLTELHLTSSVLTDEGIKPLPRALRRLHIGKAKITDVCIPDLPPLLVQLTATGLSKDLLRRHLCHLKFTDA